MPEPFSRYADLIDDWPAFQAAIARPLPVTLWTNPARLNRCRLMALLGEDGVGARVMDWHSLGLRADPAFAPGRHWGLFGGLFQIQEEVAMLPVSLLDPGPGERVLDLCAAPGNKTAQIAVAMGGRGTVVANELKRGRLGALRQTIKRLGLANVALTDRPAQEFPLRTGPFDRVLVDAPCSGEGTVRKNARALAEIDAGWRERLAGQQQRMLARALQLVRPGGRVVYATCTFAPEENECVVDTVLERFGGDVRLVPASVPGFNAAAGVTAWGGRRLDARLADTLRVWPHSNDTGGFYVAVLERVAGPEHTPRLADPGAADECPLRELGTWYGLPEDWLDGLAAVPFGSRYLHLVSDNHRLPAHPSPVYWGFPAVGVQVRPAKLTTAAALRFGDRATRRVVEADAAQAAAFLRRAPFATAARQRVEDAGEGHVLVRYRGFTLGVGELGGATVHSLYPRAWASLAATP